MYTSFIKSSTKGMEGDSLCWLSITFRDLGNLGGMVSPAARCTNSRSGPRTSPKFVQIIPDRLCLTMVAGIHRPFAQIPSSYFFQD